jgi:hypothetical protein
VVARRYHAETQAEAGRAIRHPHQTTLFYRNAKQEAFWGPVEGRLIAMLENVAISRLRFHAHRSRKTRRASEPRDEFSPPHPRSSPLVSLSLQRTRAHGNRRPRSLADLAAHCRNPEGTLNAPSLPACRRSISCTSSHCHKGRYHFVRLLQCPA